MVGFAAVYLSWGTTYLATRIGVGEQHMPPALFGGSRVALAGFILLTVQWFRGATIRMPRHEFLWVSISALLLFVGGNGLINAAQQTVESGKAAILVATTPLFMALLEALHPRGDRLLPRGWIGLFIGLGGVLLLRPASIEDARGPIMALISAMAWAIGSLVLRYHRPSGSHLVTAAVQMVVGGLSLCLVGLVLGEASRIPNPISRSAVGAYMYLLIFGSLIGFVAFNWLIGHVSSTLVGTYAYVNPLIAVIVGRVVGGEELTGAMIAGMVVILVGVALVRGATRRPEPRAPQPRPPASGLTGYWNNPTSGREDG
jgi:drug/metabolite transporter (DMT)-like permease